MKRSETEVGMEVVIGSYGQRAEIVSLEGWSKATWRGYHVSTEDLVEHSDATDGDLKKIGPKFACVMVDERTRRATASFQKTRGSGVLVRIRTGRDGGSRYDVSTLSALKPAAEFDAERRAARESRENAERVTAERRARVQALPEWLRSTDAYGNVVVRNLDLLEKIIAAAATLDDLVGLGLVSEETIEQVEEDAARAQLRGE